MGIHKNFIEYTFDEINKIKSEVWKKHKCPYMSFIANTNDNTALYNRCCNYILYTGKMRDCMPDDCKHYLDKNVTKRTNFGKATKDEYEEY